MELTDLNGLTPEIVAKRMLWLAWQACGGTAGMGFLRNNAGASEEDVFKNAVTRGDYACSFGVRENEIYADYVFGRMMKLCLTINEGTLMFPDITPRSDYQAWCRKYPTYADLARAALESLVAEKQSVGS